jgi:arylsulfatase A-like enzyme
VRILYLDLDTTRPDHLGCYGYHRDTSPNIDRIAAEGVRYDNYYCSDAPCLPSRTALVTGMHGIHTGVVGHGGVVADLRVEGPSRGFRDRQDRECLPALLRSAGLHTALVSPFAQRHASWSFYAGFSEMHNTGKGGGESAEEITPAALAWIDANAKRDDWFLHVNYWDPHTPYRAPAEFGNPFESEPLPDWIDEERLAYHQTLAGPHSALDIGMYHGKENDRFPRAPGEVRDMRGLRRMFDGYDCGIRYMDEHIGRLFDALDAQGAMDDLIVIISSDHGENMGELGIYGEHGTADYITNRIPMIIRWPGGMRGHVDTDLHYNLDLAPTLAELLEKGPSSRWDGRSYAPSIQKGASCGWEHLVLGQCAHGAQRSVRFDNYLYIRTYHDGYHPHFEQEMLFDVSTDPHETENLAQDRREICLEAVYRLTGWHDRMMRTMPFARKSDPMWDMLHTSGPLHAMVSNIEQSNYYQRLRDTGRGAWIEEMVHRHPETAHLA